LRPIYTFKKWSSCLKVLL